MCAPVAAALAHPAPPPAAATPVGGNEPPQGAARSSAKELNCLKRGTGTQGWERFPRQGLGEHGGALPHGPHPGVTPSYSSFLSLPLLRIQGSELRGKDLFEIKWKSVPIVFS